MIYVVLYRYYSDTDEFLKRIYISEKIHDYDMENIQFSFSGIISVYHLQ